MTREEQLKQEAEEYQIKLKESFTPLEQICWGNIYKAYIAGVEPREKRIEELEKKNKELEETLKTYNGCGDWDTDFHACRVYLQHEELQDLQEENAELKEKLESAEKARDYWKDSSFDWRHKCTSSKPFRVAVKAQKQLTKATELIEDMYDKIPSSHSDYYKDVMDRARQFLQEIEK